MHSFTISPLIAHCRFFFPKHAGDTPGDLLSRELFEPGLDPALFQFLEEKSVDKDGRVASFRALPLNATTFIVLTPIFTCRNKKAVKIALPQCAILRLLAPNGGAI